MASSEFAGSLSARAAEILRKIEVGMGAVELVGLAVPGFGRRDRIVKEPKVVMLPAVGDPRPPFVPFGVHADIPGGPATRPRVGTILGRRAHPQIAAPVVQAVAMRIRQLT
jgi:hypothetical protein